MRLLVDCNPQWAGLLRDKNHGEGITLDCPACGPSHTLCAYFSNPLDGKDSAPWQNPKWERIGDRFDSLTLKPSIQYPCFHGWIEGGMVFDVTEAPMTIADQQGRPVALSPLQTIELGESIAQKGRNLLAAPSAPQGEESKS